MNHAGKSILETECWNSVSWRDDGNQREERYDREGRRKYLNQVEGQKFLEEVVQLPTLNALFRLNDLLYRLPDL